MTYKYPSTRALVAGNEWEEVSYERYMEMLEILPPERMEGGAFLVGEPLNHLTDESGPRGEAIGVFDAYVELDGRYFHRPEPVDRFDPERYRSEVRSQIA